MGLKEQVNRWLFIPPFLFLFFYLFFIYNSSLNYQIFQPMFLCKAEFFQDFLNYPGGITDWLTLFVWQFYSFNWLGSLIITIFIFLIWVAVWKILKILVHNKFLLFLSFLPLILLLIFQNQYNFPLVIEIKYLIALSLLLVYLKVPNRFRPVMILFSGLFYYLIGGCAFGFYILMCIISEFVIARSAQSIIHSGLNLLVYLIFPFLATRFLFLITPMEAFLYLYPYEYHLAPFLFKSGVPLYFFFLSLPLLLVMIYAALRFFPNQLKPLKTRQSPPRLLFIELFLVILFGGCILFFSFNGDEKKKQLIDNNAENGNWQEVLKIAASVKEADREIRFYLNRALYHDGQLLEKMFKYNQSFGKDALFLNQYVASQITIQSSELYFDLGHINAAQTMAYEGQTKFKYNPRLLKMLVLTNIINEKYQIAQNLLTLLDYSLIYKKWVRKYQRLLDDKNLIKLESIILTKRAQIPEKDFFIDNDQPDIDLIQMLENSIGNRMAFEYLIAYWLLDCRLGQITHYFEYFEKLGYEKLPRHIEEVALLMKVLSRNQFQINERRIAPETLNRFIQFNLAMKQFGQPPDDKKAAVALKTQFGDTYWYYIRFINPRKNNVKLTARKVSEEIF